MCARTAGSSTDSPGPRGVSPQGARLNSLLAGQKEALELALVRAPIETVLAVLARTAQTQVAPGCFTALFVLEPNSIHLRLRASVDLPEAHASAVEAFPVGADGPPAAAAAFTGKPVVIEDLTSGAGRAERATHDPRWQTYLGGVTRFDLRACWAHPIRTSAGQVLGALVVYHRDPRPAEPFELDRLDILSHTAALVIERDWQSKELEAANREKDEFLAMLAHELRNPLSAIASAAELLSRAGENEALCARAGGIIQRQTGQLARLVDDLLEVSRLTHVRIVLQHEVLELPEIIVCAVETVTPLLESKRHVLSITSDGARRRGRCGAAQSVRGESANECGQIHRPGRRHPHRMPQGRCRCRGARDR